MNENNLKISNLTKEFAECENLKFSLTPLGFTFDETTEQATIKMKERYTFKDPTKGKHSLILFIEYGKEEDIKFILRIKCRKGVLLKETVNNINEKLGTNFINKYTELVYEGIIKYEEVTIERLRNLINLIYNPLINILTTEYEEIEI